MENPASSPPDIVPAPEPMTNAAAGDTQAATTEVAPSKADFSLMNKVIRTALLESSNNVEIIRSDPNSPLHSVKSFEELSLDPAFLRGIYDMGFSKPSKIQETALPILITQRQNMIAQSQSGTGKTAAFVLASLTRVDVNQKHPQVMILSPTYDLAVQTYQVAKTMAKFKTELTLRLVAKGEAIDNNTWTEHVLIGTPGRMVDSCLRFKNVDVSKIKVYVLDEADVMIDTQGHKGQTMRIRKALPNDCQILLFSATYDDEIRKFATDIVPNATEIRLKKEEQSLANIKQYYVITRSDEDKYRAMAHLYGTISVGQTFVFCQTKQSARFLSQRLKADGHEVGFITGDLSPEERTKALLDFKEGRQRILIATNVMARGIDIDQVTLVVNYDLPIEIGPHRGTINKETYLHRIGRTGRFGRDGLAINFISIDQKRLIDDLQQYFGQPIEELNAFDYEELRKLEEP